MKHLWLLLGFRRWLGAGCVFLACTLCFSQSDLPSGVTQTTFLKPDAAFALEYAWKSPTELIVRWAIAEDYYLYRKQLKIETVGFDEPVLPQGEFLVDEFFGESEVYFHELVVPLKVTDEASLNRDKEVQLGWQGCAKAGLCYPPATRKLSFSPSGQLSLASLGTSGETGQAEDLRLADQLAELPLIVSALLFFGLGVLLAFTPCVLPMVPILSSLLIGAGEITRWRSFSLSLTYVVAMATVYAGAGALAAFTGASLQSLLQTPAVLYSFSLLMIVLAASMFGLFELRIPAVLNNFLIQKSNKQSGGNLAGVAFMGGLSALIVGPCVAPPLIGVLIYISQSNDILTGGTTLFAMGLGMGVPLIAVGVAMGNALPKSGAWMTRVSQFFGFVLLGLAIWFLERVVTGVLASSLWALLALVWGIWLLWAGVWRTKSSVDSGAANKQRGLWPLAGRAFAFITGSALLLWGGAIVLILAGVFFPQSEKVRSIVDFGLSPAYEYLGIEGFKADFEVSEMRELDENIAASDGNTMLDFYADWCVECHKMERELFTQAQIAAQLRNWTVIRVDITDNDASAQEILKKYEVIGPPTLIFLSSDGREVRSKRIVGYPDIDILNRSLTNP